MTSIQRILAAGIFLLVSTGPIWIVPAAAQSARAKQVGMKLKCLCHGCDMAAGICSHPGGAFSGPCETAKGILHEVDGQLAQGKNEAQIIQYFVKEYGSIVYIEPPKSGFGLVAWVTPFAFLLLGAGLIVLVLRKWLSRGHSPSPATVSGPSVTHESLQRARAKIALDTRD
jgi:cytochrome c-type biogenesis protein CcmH/NrfF